MTAWWSQTLQKSISQPITMYVLRRAIGRCLLYCKFIMCPGEGLLAPPYPQCPKPGGPTAVAGYFSGKGLASVMECFQVSRWSSVHPAHLSLPLLDGCTPSSSWMLLRVGKAHCLQRWCFAAYILNVLLKAFNSLDIKISQFSWIPASLVPVPWRTESGVVNILK